MHKSYEITHIRGDAWAPPPSPPPAGGRGGGQAGIAPYTCKFIGFGHQGSPKYCFVLLCNCGCLPLCAPAHQCVCLCASEGCASCSYLNRTCLLMRETVRVRTRQNGHACVVVRGRLKVCKTMCVHGCVFGMCEYLRSSMRMNECTCM